MAGRLLSLALALVFACPTFAIAGDLTKEQCVDAHSRGQDAKEAGKLSLARRLFLSCAQSRCPGAVQTDCARFADDLANMQPTIVLVARDSNGNDLPHTSVYVDGVLAATRLDGKPIDIDPGSHTVRFTRGGTEQSVTVVVGSGEKGRAVAARFAAPTHSRTTVMSPALERASPVRRVRRTTTHPGGSMAVAIGGVGLALAGAAVAFYGASRVPSSCSLSTHECAAPTGDPVFEEAAAGTRTMNIGIVTGAVGVTMLAGGLLWYYAGAKTTSEKPTQVSPILTHDSAGFAVSGRF